MIMPLRSHDHERFSVPQHGELFMIMAICLVWLVDLAAC
jgi:hypothetical protein